ncbi:MAG: DUF465 domain-containing protein [Hyphomicrobiales bacterium]|nr:DUF465 domain-containing protein [Hyphomicrobiales bacterium]
MGDRPANDEKGSEFESKSARRKRLSAALSRLKQEHRDLDAAITSLEASVHSDQLQLKRLKKKKLLLKDEIAQTEDELFPDIIA